MRSVAWKDAVTVYSYYKDKDISLECFQKNLLYKCFWNKENIQKAEKLGVKVQGAVSLFIPYLENNNYLPYRQWLTLNKEERKDIYTLNNGADNQESYILPFVCPFEFREASGRGFLNQIEEFEKEYPNICKAIL